MMAPYEHEVAPYRFEDLRAIGRVTLRPRDLNWKTIADNYSDHLHIPVGHPGLTRLFGQELQRSRRRSGSTGWRASFATTSRPIRRSGPISACLPEAEHLPPTHRRKWLYYKLFPSVAFDIYPDQVDFMQCLAGQRDRDVIREISYALPDDRREMKAARYPELAHQPPGQCRGHRTDQPRPAGHGQPDLYRRDRWARARYACRSFSRKLRRLIPEARLERPPAPGWTRGN